MPAHAICSPDRPRPAVGLAVATGLVVAAPAHAAGTSSGAAALLGGVYPQIDGVGSITNTVAGVTTTCTNTDPLTTLTCSTLPSLLGVVGGTLTAVPAASNYQFAGWTNCPGNATGATCTYGPLASLATSPVATFVQVLGGGTGGGTTTLTTLLTQKPEATTTSDVLFGLGTDPADPAATFTCTLDGPSQAGTKACTSPVTYSGLADGVYKFTATAKSGTVTGTPVSYVFTVASTTPLAPETTLTSGPPRWLLGRGTRIGLSSDQSGAHYACTLDGKALEGCTDPVSITRLTSRTHVFRAAAINTLGVEDASPATRTFTVPVNNTGLKASTGWAKRKHRGHFLNTFSQTKRKGATLKLRRSGIKAIALVVTKGRGNGTVKVFLGRTLLKKVSLSANRTVGKRVVLVKKFSSKKRGVITVKVVSRGKPVRIEGLGVASR